MNRRLLVVRELTGKGARALRGQNPECVALPEYSGFPIDLRARTVKETDHGAVRIESPEGAYRHPVATAFNVIGLCQRERLGSPVGGASENVRQEIEASVRALLDMQETDGSYRYPVSVPRYGVKPGWSSGMAQGLVVGAFSESASLLSDVLREAVVPARSRAADHLLTSVEEGGCTSYVWGGPFFEECPTGKPSGILNGACFAVLGLQMSDRPQDIKAAEEAVSQMGVMARRWDLGYWSRYDLLDMSPASPDYHSLHVDLLMMLGARAQSKALSDLGETFRQQMAGRSNRYHALGSLSARRLVGIARGHR